MGAEIIPFGRKVPAPNEATAEDERPHLSGEAVCGFCNHVWVAIRPTGEIDKPPPNELYLECPACHAYKGVFRRFVGYSDCPSWTCLSCGRHLFTIVIAKGETPCVVCVECGFWTHAMDIFNLPPKPPEKTT